MISCQNWPGKRQGKSIEKYNYTYASVDTSFMSHFLNRNYNHREMPRKRWFGVLEPIIKDVNNVMQFLFYILTIIYLCCIVNEHKKMVAEKLGEKTISLSHNNPVTTPELGELTEEATPNHQLMDYETGTCSSAAGRTSRLQTLLNCELWMNDIPVWCIICVCPDDPVREATPTIPNAWAKLKHENERRMKPLVEYSLYMRVSTNPESINFQKWLFSQRFANPTSKQLLRYYDQPIRVNSQSGEVTHYY